MSELRILVTMPRRVYDMIRARANPLADFRDEARPRPNGYVAVPFAQETISRLRIWALPGEAAWETLERLFTETKQ